MKLTDNLLTLKGVGAELSKKFGSLGIHTIGDLVSNYPRKYGDYSHVQAIRDIKPGTVTIKARITQAAGRYVRRGMHVTEGVASDESGSVRLIWFNQPYRAVSIQPDSEYYVSGDFGLRHQRLSIQNPSIELVSSFPVNTARIVPIYRETKGLKSYQIRKVLKNCLPIIRNIPETLPDWSIRGELNKAEAIEALHFPADAAQLVKAKRRLGFEEVFELSLAALLNKQQNRSEQSIKIPFNEQLAKEFVSHLPFSLTDAQRKAVWQIYQDMRKSEPMNRLLEGDVGSGKTVVAAMAGVMAMSQGFQVALMAPTEILARQHAETIYDLLTPLGMNDRLTLLVGSLKPAQKRTAHESIKSGQAGFIVGTHALIQEKVDMHRLGLIIVDEQHRFGVEHRKTLQKKAGHMPHVLNMTATPIPRSLALTLYGELDITVLGAKPAGRKPVLTKICSPNSRKQLYEKIDRELERGRQMFIVCPVISDKPADKKPQSVEKVHKDLGSTILAKYRVAVLHGKQKPAEKEKIMQSFAQNQLDILISTTVIEVGVDVPNATVMLIENAERFGLAQIHQLRGRVGRSGQQGYCFLMQSDSSPPSRRLRALEQSNDGFSLAELDLEIRGPGAIYGTIQHGALDLRIAQLTDVKLIARARHAAQEFIDKGESLLDYKQLNKRINELRAITNLN